MLHAVPLFIIKMKRNNYLLTWKNHILLFIMMKSFNQKIYSRNILFLKDAIYIVSAPYEQFYQLFSSALLYIPANTGDDWPSTIRGPVLSVFPSRQLSWVNIYFFNCWVDFAKDHCSVSCVVIFSMRQTLTHFGKLRRLVESSCELLQIFTLLYSWKLFQSELPLQDPCPALALLQFLISNTGNMDKNKEYRVGRSAPVISARLTGWP